MIRVSVIGGLGKMGQETIKAISNENDMEGAKGAGWNAIWYNHRNHRPTGSAEPDYMVRSEKELLELLSQVASGK